MIYIWYNNTNIKVSVSAVHQQMSHQWLKTMVRIFNDSQYCISWKTALLLSALCAHGWYLQRLMFGEARKHCKNIRNIRFVDSLHTVKSINYAYDFNLEFLEQKDISLFKNTDFCWRDVTEAVWAATAFMDYFPWHNRRSWNQTKERKTKKERWKNCGITDNNTPWKITQELTSQHLKLLTFICYYDRKKWSQW